MQFGLPQRPDMLFPHCWKTYGIYIENDSFSLFLLKAKNSSKFDRFTLFSKAQASKPTWLALELLTGYGLLFVQTCPDRPALFYLPWPILWLSPCLPIFLTLWPGLAHESDIYGLTTWLQTGLFWTTLIVSAQCPNLWRWLCVTQAWLPLDWPQPFSHLNILLNAAIRTPKCSTLVPLKCKFLKAEQCLPHPKQYACHSPHKFICKHPPVPCPLGWGPGITLRCALDSFPEEVPHGQWAPVVHSDNLLGIVPFTGCFPLPCLPSTFFCSCYLESPSDNACTHILIPGSAIGEHRLSQLSMKVPSRHMTCLNESSRQL